MASSHPQCALSHSENRFKVCVVCMEKGAYKITDIVFLRIRKYFMPDFKLSVQNCRAAICGRCRALLIDIDNGKKDPNSLPEVYNLTQIQPFLRSSTRCTPNPSCDCQICITATIKSVPSRKKGRPKLEVFFQNLFCFSQ